MTRYLLDTNSLSDMLRRPRGPVRTTIQRRGLTTRVLTSIIVAAALRFGAEKKKSDKLAADVEGLLETMTVAPFESPAETRYALLRARLERAGAPIGGNDMLIAAHALALGCVLVTDNVGEFSRVPDLRVENWLR
ncbi:type II toxin-antitoxin system VapC family toxin [Methylopila turkensis]|uniref:Ribonuclease VapC n=1 Tax=Methylopila turkensis TaxID=1437816 RepID=A0A9W6N6F4_9HYPH|nr:type II toxin-antitoxin system VapC family toxin [Methylopila turkensis]GLK79286.1 ribonuclease VapC [Methylopila turkensis]